MGLKELSTRYDKWAKDNPEAKLALDVAPYSGTATSIADVANEAYKGNYDKAVANSLGLIPGLKAVRKLLPGVGAVKGTVTVTKNTAPNAVKGVGKVLDAGNDADEYRQAKEDGYKRGGKVRSTGFKGYGKAKKV